jgi:ribosomal protein S18 acetylase RimI-like enzyme
MIRNSIEIVGFDNAKHRDPVLALWKAVFGYEAAHNRPEFVIDQKLAVDDGLFFVAIQRERVIGTAMAGYDGHRGWIYSMAVDPQQRQKGIGSALLACAERRLSSLGCAKVNLQILHDNHAVQRFYQANGYTTENRISMGKQLDENIPYY